MSERLYVFDTNALISALLNAHSVPRRAFDKARAQGRIVQSYETIIEFIEVSQRRKFQRYFSSQERQLFVRALIKRAKVVSVRTRITAYRDPKDDKFLELAAAARARAIISGDDDLLMLHPFETIAILTPTDFIAEDAA
jgi:putative PIN family toxin of toxin-antitoxin system